MATTCVQFPINKIQAGNGERTAWEGRLSSQPVGKLNMPLNYRQQTWHSTVAWPNAEMLDAFIFLWSLLWTFIHPSIHYPLIPWRNTPFWLWIFAAKCLQFQKCSLQSPNSICELHPSSPEVSLLNFPSSLWLCGCQRAEGSGQWAVGRGDPFIRIIFQFRAGCLL